MIEIRKTEITELAILMDIFEQGKRIMRKNGNTKQWTGGYPSKGVASACLQWCYRQIPNLRADTHRDNHILQYILKKYGFQYCGIIYLLNGDERLAFQKL